MEENNNFQQNLNYPISNQNIKGNENKKLIIKKNFPINCRVCGGIASGYIYYGVMCCDGCKHFFRRCIATKDEIKCKSEGNCEIMNVPNKCKSCRFDKCILKGMNVEKLKGPHNKSIWDVRSLIEQRIGELALNGKYVERKIENYVNINLNAVFSVMQNYLIENQDSQIIDYLLLIEQNVQRIRISPTKVIDKHYDYSCKTLNDLINQQENLISKSCEYLDEEIKMPDTDYFEFLNKNGLFAIHPHSLIEDLMLIVNMAKIMPFFNKLEMSDIVTQLKNISWAIIVLATAYYSSTKLSDAVITTERLPMFAAFSGDYYKGNLTINNLCQKIFLTIMERFNRLMINEEEYVLLRAIIFSHFVTNGLTLNGQKIMLDEAEKYSKILMKLLQKRHGQLSGVKRYTELLQLIEICFRTGYNTSLLFNYLTNVYEPGRFEKVVPEALVELLQLK